jgi:SAM-dependent methyltransferase
MFVYYSIYKKFINNIKKGSLWSKIALGLAILLIMTIIINANKPIKEGFTFEKKFSEKIDDGIYDDFYASVYDDLVYSDFKNEYEIGEIVNRTNPTDESVILDLGSGTGHHLKEFKQRGFNCQGIDKSESMIRISKEKFPDINVKVGDFMKSMQFQPNEFTHITCLYFTIYYVKNKTQFFQNCYNWLKPGGYLILHLVNRDLFDPVIPAGDPFVIVSPQRFAKQRINTSNVVFNNFTYRSEFDIKSDDVDNASVFPNDIKIFREIFKDKQNGNIRQNTHKLFMETQKEILTKARNIGFIELASIDMVKCRYENQYLYILQKPN